jgi:hypothetical protein
MKGDGERQTEPNGTACSTSLFLNEYHTGDSDVLIRLLKRRMLTEKAPERDRYIKAIRKMKGQ